jgi:hypothetical protein
VQDDFDGCSFSSSLRLPLPPSCRLEDGRYVSPFGRCLVSGTHDFQPVGHSSMEHHISLNMSFATAHIQTNGAGERYIEVTTVTHIRNGDRAASDASARGPASSALPDKLVAVPSTTNTMQVLQAAHSEGRGVVDDGDSPVAPKEASDDDVVAVNDPDHTAVTMGEAGLSHRLATISGGSAQPKAESPELVLAVMERTHSIAGSSAATHALLPSQTEVARGHFREVYVLIPPFFGAASTTESSRVLRSQRRVSYKERRPYRKRSN